MSQTPPNQPSRTDDTPPRRYTATLAGEIELRWQRAWEERGAFVVPNPGQPGFDASRPKYYVLDMFPYPSGAGLHVGHPEGYTATDILSRYKRMKGFNVLHPMGYDAFGLPAEQYAIETGVHPASTTKTAIENFRRQLKRFGFCYDWSREFATIDPGYYKWTQWIFLKLYDAWYDDSAAKCRPIAALIDQQAKLGATREGGAWGSLTEDQRRAFVDSRRLAYLAETTVNWCPRLGTVLANDEVIDGKSERGGHPVLRKPMKQWMFRITALAERLLKNLEKLDWPTSTKTMQAEWIGRSEGAKIRFEISGLKSETSDSKFQISDHHSRASRLTSHASRLTSLTVFTTRPDTVFGATYMVVAPEHDLCVRVLAGEFGVDEPTRAALRKYVTWARNRSDLERQESKKKTGVFTGIHANNPATGENIPVWTADYVLMGYGHGAIMAVPAHDERDFEFANEFGLPIRDVVYPRTVLAMRYFALHSREQERRPEVWADQLADFLGLVTSSNAPETEFEQALARVRAGRRASALQSGVSAQTGSSDAERRGAIKGAWTETIDDMGLESPAQLREQFERGRYYAASGAAHPGSGVNVNSGPLDGLHTPESKKAIGAWLSERGVGGEKVTYRLRDWTFSRQRYWGEPFPIVYDADGRAYPVSEARLPVTLPELADYAPVESDDPMPLLGKVTGWRKTTAGEAGVDPALLPAITPVTRECNTMPGSAGSSWYFLRYCDSKNDSRLVGTEAERYWMGGSGIGLPADASGAKIGGVDFYLGGSEHAVGHLLYARFWQNVLFDLGYVGTPEPFQRLFHQGMITSFAYQRADKSLVPVDQVDEPHEGKFIERATGKPVAQIVAKMSKSLKNVVNPDDVIAEYGADTFRLYEMYMGPLEAGKPWNPRDIAGCFRFLQRAWRAMVDEQTGELRAAPSADAAIEKLLHRTIAKVGEDIERLAFNTAIAAMIELVNAATGAAGTNPALTRDQVARFSLILAPFAPHMAEEVWAKLGTTGFIAHAPWPTHDPAMLTDETVELAVQIQGKVRGHIRIATDAPTSAIEAAALAEPRVVEALAGRPVKKVIVVPRKLVNVVV